MYFRMTIQATHYSSGLHSVGASHTEGLLLAGQESRRPDSFAKRLSIGWCLSILLHMPALWLFGVWISELKELSKPIDVERKKPSEELIVTLKAAPLEPPIDVNREQKVEPSELLSRETAVASPAPEAPAEPLKEVVVEAVTTGESGLMRYEFNESTAPALSTSASPTEAFAPRIERDRAEARRVAALKPALREETVSTERSIAGQLVMKTETGCAVLIELPGASRLDAQNWAYVGCNEQSQSERMADGMRSALRARVSPAP